jgi:cellobiose phosphorylase
MYRLIVESLLGLTLEKACLRFAPCLPADWSGFAMRYRYGETTYDIAVRQTLAQSGASIQPVRVTVDGVAQPGAAAQLVDDRAAHQVLVEVQAALGPASGPPGVGSDP